MPSFVREQSSSEMSELRNDVQELKEMITNLQVQLDKLGDTSDRMRSFSLAQPAEDGQANQQSVC